MAIKFLPERLMELREALGLTRVQVCRRLAAAGLAVSENTWAAWERGERSPDADDLAKVCNALGVRVGRFFEEAEASAGGARR